MSPDSTRRRTSNSSSSSGRQTTGPERVGILSRTLSSSSTIRWILPARIRSTSKNDVVFVGHTFVQLREFQQDGQLVETTAQLDFGVAILDAKVISADIESIPILDAIFNQERDQEHYSIRGEPVSDGQPPQLVVLATADNDLIFIYARQINNGDVHLVFAKRSFLRGAGLPVGFCRDIVVDPRSRALAVAPYSSFFCVFNLRGLDEIKSAIDVWDPLDPPTFQPAKEQRFVQVDGEIVLMSFLPPPKPSSSKVILLVLVRDGDEIYQYLYEWNFRKPLKTLEPMDCSGRRLREIQIPTMLIAGTRPYTYMVVMPAGISHYENVHYSEMKRVHCGFAQDPKSKLEWVQWSRPRRHTQYLQRHDDIVIVREDGLLKNFLIDKDSTTKFNTNNTIGHLGFSVDTAFCMLSGPLSQGGDIIIAGGSMANGGVFHVTARSSPRMTQSLEILGPLNDIVNGPAVLMRREGTSSHTVAPKRLYACSGPHGGLGQVSEISYGLEAQVGWTIDMPDAATTEHLFSLEIPALGVLFLVASRTTDSSMLVYRLNNQEMTLADGETHRGFDFDHPTLAAVTVGEDMVQVTTAGIRAISVEHMGMTKAISSQEFEIMQAAVLDKDRAVVVTRRSSSGYEICLLGITPTTPSKAIQIRLQQVQELWQEPNSICCTSLGTTVLIMVGTASGEILGFDQSLRPVFEHTIHDLDGRVDNVPISTMAVLKQNTKSLSLLLCGLRSGMLLGLTLKEGRGNSVIDAKASDLYSIGATTVRVVPEQPQQGSSDTSSALVLCEDAVYRVTLHNNSAVADHTLSRVLVTDREKSGSPCINAVHRIPKLTSKYDHPGTLLICATTDELLICGMIAQEHGIVRHLQFNGIPKRLLYSPFLQKFAVAFTQEGKPNQSTEGPFSMIPPPPKSKNAHDKPDRKVQRVGIQLVNQNLTLPSSSDAEATFSTLVSEDDSDIVRDFINWAPTDGENHYEWLVLAIERPIIVPPGLRGHGRVVCINAKGLGRGKPDAQPKVAWKDSKPVTAICAYKMSSLLIACGKDLILRNLNFRAQRWETLARHPLPSFANAISCQGSLICVATAEHSMFVLVERDGALHQHQCDTQMRYAKDIALLDASTAVFASADAHGTNVVGLTGLHKENSKATPLFQARIPGHIHRFCTEEAPGSRASDRIRFYGASIDGTLYHFSLLKPKEWKLLHFIEGMSYMHRKHIKAVPMKKRGAEGQESLWKPPNLPREMHVHGDLLLMMVEDGPYNLRNMIRGSEQIAELGALVNEVVGKTEEPVEVAIAWVRKLLTYPPRS